MPNYCEGLPDGPCPENRHDGSVKFGICDLFLCPSCEESRLALRPAQHSSTETATAKEPSSRKGKQVKHSTKGGTAIKAGNDNSTVSSKTTTGVSANQTDKPNATATLDRISEMDGTADQRNPIDAGSQASSASESTIIINELLTYVSYYRNRSQTESLRRVVLTAFPPTTITDAKKALVQRFQAVLSSCALTADRRSSTARAAHEAEIDDIIGIFTAVDLQGALDNTVFAAANLDVLPKFGPEEINFVAIANRQARVETAIDNIAATVGQLAAERSTPSVTGAEYANLQSTVVDIQSKLDAFTSSVDARLEQLNSVCRLSASTANNERSSPNAIQHIDRKSNVVVFGIKEDRDATVWRRNVEEALIFVVDRPVDVIDMFRLGRYDAGKTRPILVKLRVVWDTRLLLSNSSKLKHYDQQGIFISADETVEVRRKQTLDRLKYRAERAGKITSIDNGVLIIDGSATFSLLDGFINTHHG